MAIRRCAECSKTLEGDATGNPSLRPTWVRLVREPDPAQPEPVQIMRPQDVFAFLYQRTTRELVEVFYVLTLDVRSRIISCQEVTRGILNASLVHPREVFRLAIAEGAAAIIVVHNHPSGDPTPSVDDRSITKQLVDAGKIIDIPVHDHVIIGGGSYLSFAEAGLL